MNAALQRLLDSRSIEPFPAADDEIVGRWAVAVGSLLDSRRVLSVETRISVAYQAGLQGAMTLVRNAGYRLRSSPGGHHYVTFAALAALDEPDLARLGEEMNRLRRTRHEAVYDWRPQAEADQELEPDRLDGIVSDFMKVGLDVLVRTRPQIAGMLARPG
jgi:hypothetical protein